MGISVRQAHPLTLDEAVEATQSYRSLDISSMKSHKKKKKRHKKKKKRCDSSDSSSSEEDSSSSEFEEESSSSSDSESSSLKEDQKRKKKKKLVKSKKKKVSRGEWSAKVAPAKTKVDLALTIKDKSLDNKVDELSNQLKAKEIHFIGMQPNRRRVPVSRDHVWCVKCGQFGHIPQECPNTPVKVHYVGEEAVEPSTSDYGGTTYYYLEEVSDVYQVTQGPRNFVRRPTMTYLPAPPIGEETKPWHLSYTKEEKNKCVGIVKSHATIHLVVQSQGNKVMEHHNGLQDHLVKW
ncbi:unnamed protein product [Calypogeia fissa]